MGLGKNWTAEEDEILCDWWGNHSVEAIAKKLGRSEGGVINRVNRLGLPGFLQSSDKYVTLFELTKAVGYNGSQGYLKTSWMKNRGLPTHRIKRRKQAFDVIYVDEFWEWAEKNKTFLDFSKFERYALGPEPEWADQKRRRDYQRSRQRKTTPWTKMEDDRLKKYISEYRYTYAELSQKLNRTTGAIQRRLCNLNIKGRPLKADNHIKWTDEEYHRLAEMIKAGYDYEYMSDMLGKSSKAIRGRVFDKYLTEVLDKVREYIGDGEWGDGCPDFPLKYMRLMPPGEKEAAKGQLAVLASVLLERAKEISGAAGKYKDYFQKDMCVHWDDVKGCLAGEAGCDYCISFERIEPQYCTRCGAAFYERKENKICLRCRRQRIRQAQRKYAELKRKGKL